MPKLRAIDFENLTNDEAKRVVKDILLKYPRGPLQRQKKADYTLPRYSWEDTWLSSLTNDAQEAAAAGAGCWGYTDEQAYLTIMEVFGGARPDQWNIRQKLWAMHPEWSQVKATRSAKRFWSRFGRSCERHIKTLNVEKLYTFSSNTPTDWIVGDDYQTRRRRQGFETNVGVTVTASSEAEAKVAAQAMFGHAVTGLHCSRTVDWKASNEGNAVAKNNDSLARLDEKKREIAQTIADYQKQLAAIELAEEAIQMYNITIFGDDN